MCVMINGAERGGLMIGHFFETRHTHTHTHIYIYTNTYTLTTFRPAVSDLGGERRQGLAAVCRVCVCACVFVCLSVSVCVCVPTDVKLEANTNTDVSSAQAASPLNWLCISVYTCPYVKSVNSRPPLPSSLLPSPPFSPPPLTLFVVVFPHCPVHTSTCWRTVAVEYSSWIPVWTPYPKYAQLHSLLIVRWFPP